MARPRNVFSWLAVLEAAVVLFDTADGRRAIVERQNPDFITLLPTVAPDFSGTDTTASVSTVVSPTTLPTTSQLSLQTTTPTAPKVTPNPTFPLTSVSSALTTPLPSSVADTSEPDAQQTKVVGDTFFGRVPTANPDAAVISMFLLVFILFGIMYWFAYWTGTRTSKQNPQVALPKSLALFCLARVATCILRLIRISMNSSAELILVAIVTENAGTILLIAVNFYLTKQMISFCILQYSLWVRSVVKKVVNTTVSVVLLAVFLLHFISVALVEIQLTSGRKATVEATLYQVSETLSAAIGLLFNLVVLVTMVSTPLADVDRLTLKIFIYILGAGILTLVSQLMRLIAAFMIWKPVTPLSAQLLSKPAYYLSGFGAEVLILILYCFWETNMMASTWDSFRSRCKDSTKRLSVKLLGGEPRPQSHMSLTGVLRRMSSISSKKGEDDYTNEDLDEPTGPDFRSTIISTSRAENCAMDDENGAGSSKACVITVHREFTVSSTTDLRESWIGKAV